jgi:methionyl-tRNA formyltransferase
MKTKTIFIGTPEFAVTILQKLLQKGYEPLLVITTPDKPVGRKSILTAPPVKDLAKRHGITVEQPFRIIEIKDKIKSIAPDLMIVAAYGYIIPKEVFTLPKHGTINVHPSLLPKFRGPSPIQTAIMEGELNCGVTIIKIDEEIDHGPIIAKKAMEMPKGIYYKDLEAKLAELGANLLVETIPKWINKKIEAEPQDDLVASFTKIITKEDGKINWTELRASEVERKIRALQPWPSTYAYWEKGTERIMVKILQAETTAIEEFKTPGKVYSGKKDKIMIRCKEGSLIIKRLQLEGRNPLTDKEFVLGQEGFIGSVLK